MAYTAIRVNRAGACNQLDTKPCAYFINKFIVLELFFDQLQHFLQSSRFTADVQHFNQVRSDFGVWQQFKSLG